jgi:uncharacterized protein YjbJ (UPF0337 family)
MNTQIVAGNWRQLKGIVLQKWGRLTHDDFLILEGRHEYWAGELQEARGIALDDSRRHHRATGPAARL